jgi:hypothetical protein
MFVPCKVSTSYSQNVNTFKPSPILDSKGWNWNKKYGLRLFQVCNEVRYDSEVCHPSLVSNYMVTFVKMKTKNSMPSRQIWAHITYISFRDETWEWTDTQSSHRIFILFSPFIFYIYKKQIWTNALYLWRDTFISYYTISPDMFRC